MEVAFQMDMAHPMVFGRCPPWPVRGGPVGCAGAEGMEEERVGRAFSGPDDRTRYGRGGAWVCLEMGFP